MHQKLLSGVIWAKIIFFELTFNNYKEIKLTSAAVNAPRLSSSQYNELPRPFLKYIHIIL